MRRLACLDGLRGVLAVYVLVSHMAPFSAFPWWMVWLFLHGEAAVDVFFILSGMVIAGSLESFGWQAKPFLVARAARLLPVFFIAFPLAVAVQPLPMGLERMPWIDAENTAARMTWSDDWPATWVPEIAAHLAMIHGLFPNFVLPNAWVSFLGAAWSLSTEWQFYFLMAALPAAFVGWRERLELSRTAIMLLSLAAAAWVWTSWMPPEWQFSKAFLPNEAQYFALGLASAMLWREPGPRVVGLYATVLAGALILGVSSGGAGKLAAPLVWTACLMAELGGPLPGTGLLRRVLQARLLLWLGAISYPLYLINEPVQKALGVALSTALPGQAAMFTLLWVPGAILIPIGLGWLLHRTVEVPCQGYRLALTPRVIVG
jgi:peptidoglycan/LPS O-acetylase OafA/YrhL